MTKTQRRLTWISALVPLTFVALLVAWIAIAATVYPAEYVRRVLLLRETDVYYYLEYYPARSLTASHQP